MSFLPESVAERPTARPLLPSNWKRAELGDLRPFVTSGARGWARYYADFGSAFLRITNLSRQSIYLDLSDVKWLRVPADNSECARTQVKTGDLLISITADIGIIGYVDATVPSPAYINQHIALLRFDPEKVDSKFLSYYLASEEQQRAFRAGTDQGAKAGMNLSEIRRISATLPPLPEQHAVADALSDVDALLMELDALLTKKRDLKQAAMQQLLTGKTRLQFSDRPWQTAGLGTLFVFSGGLSASREQLSSSGHCYLHYGDIHLSTKQYVDVCAEGDKIPRLDIDLREVGYASLLEDGDIVFVDASEDDEGASKHIVIENPGNLPYISGLHTITAKSRGDHLDKLFKRYCFQSRHVKEQFKFYAVGTKVTGISKSNIAKIELTFPTSKEEQRAIATVLSDMDMELALVAEQRDKLLALKRGMMQQLLTGRIRLT